MAKKSNKKKKSKVSKTTNKKYFDLKGFWNEKKDVLKFLLSFIFLVLLLFSLSATDFFNVIREPLTNLYTSISGMILNIFGSNATVNGDTLSTSRFVINVKAGCDGVAPMILYWATVAVFPIQWKYKWKGLLYGTIFLFVLNLVRIISLFLAGVYVRSMFDFLHVEFWQILFIAFTIFVWVYWYRWAQKEMLADKRISS
ncbi:MAG: exosortase H [Saprospiraceae bacterium]|nr:exosortase H [Saprospiraceae bacterium]